MPGARRGQKMALNALDLELQTVKLICGFLELNPDPLQQQQVLLSTLKHLSSLHYTSCPFKNNEIKRESK